MLMLFQFETCEDERAHAFGVVAAALFVYVIVVRSVTGRSSAKPSDETCILQCDQSFVVDFDKLLLNSVEAALGNIDVTVVYVMISGSLGEGVDEHARGGRFHVIAFA